MLTSMQQLCYNGDSEARASMCMYEICHWCILKELPDYQKQFQTT